MSGEPGQTFDSGVLRSLLTQFVEPWYTSLSDPPKSQQETLDRLLAGYGKTEYGRIHGATNVRTVEEYRASFPISHYQSLAPNVDQVREGDFSSLLPEPVVRWVMSLLPANHS